MGVFYESAGNPVGSSPNRQESETPRGSLVESAEIPRYPQEVPKTRSVVVGVLQESSRAFFFRSPGGILPVFSGVFRKLWASGGILTNFRSPADHTGIQESSRVPKNPSGSSRGSSG
eukprot:7400949-Pyramimonas_sp.AAC.1